MAIADEDEDEDDEEEDEEAGRRPSSSPGIVAAFSERS